MSVHADLNLNNLSFTDDAHRHVEARSGSLVSTTKFGRFTFTTGVGDKIVHITNTATAPAVIHDVSGLIYYGGIKYHLFSWADITLSAGQDLEPNTYQNQPDFSRYVRIDGTFHLF